MVAATGTGVEGLPAFLATLDQAATELTALAPPEAGRLLVSRGEAASPRETGTLAAHHEAVITAGVVTVVAATDYAAYVHALNPWLARVLDESIDDVIDIYATDVADIVSTIKGA